MTTWPKRDKLSYRCVYRSFKTVFADLCLNNIVLPVPGTPLPNDIHALNPLAPIIVPILSHTSLDPDVFIYVRSDDLATSKQELSPLRLILIHSGLYWTHWPYCGFTGSLLSFTQLSSCYNPSQSHHRFKFKSLLTGSRRFHIRWNW